MDRLIELAMELVKALVRQAQPGALGLLMECSGGYDDTVSVWAMLPSGEKAYVESVPLQHAVRTLNALQGEKAVILFGEA